jgi:DNA-binding NarL/FixJ family response regulator
MKALLIDDHPLILSAMQALLGRLEHPIESVGVETAVEARGLLRGVHDFDLVLLDLQLRDADGFAVLAEIRTLEPALPIVVVAASDRACDVMRAVNMGAMGFVPKRASNDLLAEALELVMSGGVYIPPIGLGDDSLKLNLLSDPSRTALVAGEPDDATVAAAAARDAGPTRTLESLGLTPRQTEVLRLMLAGKPNKLIARELGVSVETVKDHVAAVLRGLGVNSRTQAVVTVSKMRIEGLPTDRRAAFRAYAGGVPLS